MGIAAPCIRTAQPGTQPAWGDICVGDDIPGEPRLVEKHSTCSCSQDKDPVLSSMCRAPIQAGAPLPVLLIPISGSTEHLSSTSAKYPDLPMPATFLDYPKSERSIGEALCLALRLSPFSLCIPWLHWPHSQCHFSSH